MLSRRITNHSLIFIFLSQVSSGFSAIKMGETNDSDSLHEYIFNQCVIQLEKMIKKIHTIT